MWKGNLQFCLDKFVDEVIEFEGTFNDTSSSIAQSYQNKAGVTVSK
jgi:hypothetical protein